MNKVFYKLNVSMGEKYRPNVAAIMMNSSGQILVAERLQIPDSWQFPQGGVDKGETPLEALLREVEEELGLPPDSYSIIEERGGYRYQFPEGLKSWKKYCGQEQTYFLCEFTGDDSQINIETAHPEFSAWKWIGPSEFDLEWVVDFKRDVYVQVLSDFFKVSKGT